MSRDRPTAEFLVSYKEKSCRTNPQNPCVFSSKMGLAFNAIENLFVMRPTAPGFRIFFQGKRAPQQPFQIRVFSGKTHVGFNVIVN